MKALKVFVVAIFFWQSFLAVAAENQSPFYLIGPEDVLEISVWREEGLQKEVLVRPDGGVTFPLVGELRAKGKTTEQLRQEITEKLQKFISNPVVTVGVLKIGGNKIYVIGKVTRPGEYVTGRYVDVMQVLSMAGGLTPFAAEKDIKILRREGENITPLDFNYAAVAEGEDLEQNIVLRNGDVVVVP